ncbi:unnamed protein product [Trichogramma brassicae]|uniref:Reverse transcriptase domain-containing protein n=1 Tax=Trichogramma brassicae TaxID=86971 RepID=A0A6H5I1W3_9HYME|nr:unnamed protein product [Trichogramma brassicae]
MCEEHYVNTTVRLPDGRYQVRLPQKPNAPIDWVNSRQIAKSCLLSLERKFSRNPSLRSDYVAAMNQMVQSNQMRKVSIEPQDYGSHYFSSTSRSRQREQHDYACSSRLQCIGKKCCWHSLNENLLTGPNLLPQLVLVLAHWRCYPIAFVADVSKMYLQVRLHPEDWKLQSILWREDPRESIEHYVLTTVTFGCGPSAYLASRTLRKLAEDDGNKFPLAPPIVRHEMYMDDVLSGAFDLNTASEKRRHLCSLFSAGGFSLAKWMTNDRELLSSFDPSDRATEATLKVGLGFSVLGLVWEPQADRFYFNVSMTPLTGAITKRKVLSRIAGLFDPSGWISPSLIPLKIFMQSLRLLTKEGDVALPDAETAQWRAYEDDLQGLPSISIPRWSGVTKSARLELHGFADASKLAYAAVLYVRILHGGGARVTLLASKTKLFDDLCTESSVEGRVVISTAIEAQTSWVLTLSCGVCIAKDQAIISLSALSCVTYTALWWHFNPPSSPHFGGLWESGVKSVKYHLKRMVGDRSFTFEEFSTLLAQIEAILNFAPAHTVA